MEDINIKDFLDQDEQKDLLRILTAGSVDDGKSTLIGRLLYDSKLLYEDQVAALERDSKRGGSVDGTTDYALLLDGLKAEREQGITIDVAYRYFATSKRKFIIADTPGHEQYTRNMVTGASTANLAIILIDASKGVITQTRRHSFLISLLGIKHVLVAVNKMDLINYQESIFNNICKQYREFVTRLKIPDLHFIPLSALKGYNVVKKSKLMSWYSGAPLLEILENIHVSSDRNFIDLRFPVQYVQRPNSEFRGFAGTVASGVVRPEDEIIALPSGNRSSIKEIFTTKKSLTEAFPPHSITLTLNSEIDVSRGDMLVHPDNLPHTTQTIEAMLVWMSETPLNLECNYFLKHTTRTTKAVISRIRYQIDVNSLRKKSAKILCLNEIGRISLNTAQPIFCDPYLKNRTTGSFILIEPVTNYTVAVGMIIDRTAADDKSKNHLINEKTNITSPTQPLSHLKQSVTEQLLKHEGLRLKPYRCPAGKLTIGIGRNLEDRGISETEARFLLSNDIDNTIFDLQKIFSEKNTDNEINFDTLPENVQRVMVDMHFNLGPAGFRSFKKMISAVKTNKMTLAAQEMQDSKWFKKVGNRGIHLVKMILNKTT